MIQATLDRLEPLAGERFLVVTGRAHRDAVVAQLPELDPGRVLAEPSPRDSMAAIGLAAALLEREDPDAVMGSFAADHVVTDPDTFRDRVRVATAVARDGLLVTIGIEPTHPATGFGYIRLGDPLPGHDGAFAVEEFVEKPAADVAAGVRRLGPLPLERRHVRLPARGPARPAGRGAPGVRRLAARARRRAGHAGGGVADAAEDRDRPRRRRARGRCRPGGGRTRRVRLGRHRRLRLAGAAGPG